MVILKPFTLRLDGVSRVRRYETNSDAIAAAERLHRRTGGVVEVWMVDDTGVEKWLIATVQREG